MTVTDSSDKLLDADFKRHMRPYIIGGYEPDRMSGNLWYYALPEHGGYSESAIERALAWYSEEYAKLHGK